MVTGLIHYYNDRPFVRFGDDYVLPAFEAVNSLQEGLRWLKITTIITNISDSISEVMIFCRLKANKLSKSCGFEDVMSRVRTLGA